MLEDQDVKQLIEELEETIRLDAQETDRWETTSTKTWERWQSELLERNKVRYALIFKLQELTSV